MRSSYVAIGEDPVGECACTVAERV